MTDASNVKPGDQVSWSWGSGQPGGKASEVKESTVTMETARGNEVKKDGEAGNPAVRVERSGHDVVKKASELKVEKPGPEHGSGSGEKKEGDGVTQNDEGKDVSKGGKPENAIKADDKEKKDEGKEEKPTADHDKTEKPATNGEAKPAQQKKQSAPKKDTKPAAPKKEKAAPKPKAEKQKRKAATESGEPRRSKRIRAGE